MYNNYFCQKKKKEIQEKSKKDKRLKKWLQNYHEQVQPNLVDRYNHRVKSFVTQMQDNPANLNLYEPTDVKQQRKRTILERIQALTRKGDKYFRYKDTNDFNSYFTEAERIERQKNQTFFQKKFGKTTMIHRGIVSQSQYKPNLLNQFRRRQRQKQIQPSMKYSNRNECSTSNSRRPRSMYEKRKNGDFIMQDSDIQPYGRRNTTLSSVSFSGSQDEAISSYTVNTIKTESQNQNLMNQKGTINIKKPNRKLIKSKTKQLSKSYFIGLIDMKQNTKDPHVKKSLHNILIKVGKDHPKSKENLLPCTIEALNSQLE